MRRKYVDEVKADVKRLLDRIDVMERCAGWTRYTKNGNEATSKPHPEDLFDSGREVAAVKRTALDLANAMVKMRRW